MRSSFRSLLIASLIAGSVPSSLLASDWLRFRGPNGSGVSTDKAPAPSKWSPTENIEWKAELPGPGSSSPIIVGDKIFVTSWSGYGDKPEATDQSKLQRHLVCLDRKTGKILWDKTVKAALPEDYYEGMFAEHGFASHTPVSDGTNVYAFFGKTGVVAFDLEGNQLWQAKVGDGLDGRGWGSSSSPILYKDKVIVLASAESQALFAFDTKTGKEVWKSPADGLNSIWGTPILVESEKGRTDLVLGVPYEIWGLDPDSGKLRWFAEATESDQFCSSVVADKDVVFAIEGRGGGSIAVKSGGTDDVTKSNVVWTGRDTNRIGTPVPVDGRLYFFANKVAKCVDAATGKLLFEERLAGGANPPGGNAPGGGRPPQGGPGGQPGRGGGRGGRGGGGGGFGGQDYSSAIAADGKIYYTTRNGDTYVLEAGPKFNLISVNRVSADQEDYSSTPAISDGQLLIRSSRHLYSIRESK